MNKTESKNDYKRAYGYVIHAQRGISCMNVSAVRDGTVHAQKTSKPERSVSVYSVHAFAQYITARVPLTSLRMHALAQTGF